MFWCVFYWYGKHHDQKQLDEKGVYLAYISQSQFITEGSENRNSSGSSSKNYGGKVPNFLFHMLCLVCIFKPLRTTYLYRTGTSHSWLVLSHQSLQQPAPQTFLQVNLVEAFSLLRFLLPKWWELVSTWQNTNKHSVK